MLAPVLDLVAILVMNLVKYHGSSRGSSFGSNGSVGF